MVEFRPVCLEDERDFVLSMFVVRAFEAASEVQKRPGFAHYQQRWLASAEAGEAYRSIEASLSDPRTIAEIVVVDGVAAGFVWVTFEGAPYEPCHAELQLVAFRLNFQRRGLGRVSLHHVEELAVSRGAETIRSTGSAATEGIRRFHASLGFEPIQTVYEKRLKHPA